MSLVTSKLFSRKVPAGREYEEYCESLRNNPNGFYHVMIVKRGEKERVLVSPEVTFVTKVEKDDFSQEKSSELLRLLRLSGLSSI